MKKLLVLFIPVFILLTCASCGDNRQAQQLDGSWEGGITINYDDQSNENQDVYQNFKYIKNDYKDGGDLIEVRSCHVKNIDLDDMTMDVKYHTYIEGIWEIIAGDLYIKYNVSTLKDKVDANDVKLHYNNVLAKLNVVSDLLEGFTVYDIVDDLQKELYKDMFHEYKSDDDDNESAYQNLKIDGNSMSYTTADIGEITFEKKNVNVNKIFEE